jgi:hypothetical protein
MISAAAAPGAAPLRRARKVCSAADVLPYHTALRRSRSDCLELLDRELDNLRAVEADAQRAFGGARSARGSCTPAGEH